MYTRDKPSRSHHNRKGVEMSSAIGSVGGYNTSQNLFSIKEDSDRTRKMTGTPPEPPDPSELFGKIDTDGDGKVSKDELLSFQKQMEKNAPPRMDGTDAPKPPDASQMLSDMDTDGDGVVSKDEFTTFMENMQEQMQSKRSQVSSYNDQGGQTNSVKSTLFDVKV
jgi:Ca2+-binding EF-hand superfamily protein